MSHACTPPLSRTLHPYNAPCSCMSLYYPALLISVPSCLPSYTNIPFHYIPSCLWWIEDKRYATERESKELLITATGVHVKKLVVPCPACPASPQVPWAPYLINEGQMAGAYCSLARTFCTATSSIVLHRFTIKGQQLIPGARDGFRCKTGPSIFCVWLLSF